MQSKSDRDSIDFSAVPTTDEDLEMLQSVRQLDQLDAQGYLDFLLTFTDRHPPTRAIPPRDEPFSL